MEIEFLLRDFYYQLVNIFDWLTCSAKERNDRFRPAILRQRHAQRIGRQPQDLGEALDYRAHSELLHVSPYESPFGVRGLGRAEIVFGDACFCEIFEHARRLLFECHRLRRKLARHVRSPAGPLRGLKKVRDAWERTRQLQAIWLALLQTARGRNENDAGE